MSTQIYDLEDSIILDTGEVLIKYQTMFKLFRNGLTHIHNLETVDNNDIKKYNERRKPNKRFKIRTIDNKKESPAIKTYNFDLPDEYLNLDIDVYLAEKLIKNFPNQDNYLSRFITELVMMKERHMEDFLKTLIYIKDIFDENGVVHGIGRGSSCSSLILYLIGIHMVDPVKYDISIKEFLR
jgi:DNA polymerase III alpha subunit